jgi:uracil-DNA glycosylase family 4
MHGVTQQHVAAALDWLMLSGVDGAVSDAPFDWLAPPPVAAPVPAAAPRRAPVIQAPPPDPVADALALAAAADSLDALHAALASFPLPRHRAALAPDLWHGNPQAGVVVLLDQPDGPGPVTELLERMLAAIGLDWGTALRVHRLPWPLPGGIDAREDHFAPFAPFVSRLFTLARPRAVLALGQAAAGIAGMEARRGSRRGQWQSWEEMRLLASFHPRMVLANPHYRKQAWDDLQAFKAGLA